MTSSRKKKNMSNLHKPLHGRSNQKNTTTSASNPFNLSKAKKYPSKTQNKMTTNADAQTKPAQQHISQHKNDHSKAFPRTFQFSGYLDIRPRPDRPWKRRYFVVSNNFLLCADTPHAHELLKVIPLESSNIHQSTQTSDMTFELFLRKKRLYFRAPSPSQCKIWTKKIQKASKLKIQQVYRFIHTLGVSGDTKVVAAKHRASGDDCAIKIVDKRLCDTKMLSTEIKILRKLDHPSIVELYDIVETKKFLYIVMEKCAGGELFDMIAELDGDHYTEEDSCMVMHQIAAGVRYMHKHGIVHRDLKPENVLCVRPNSIRKVKIADFGISKMLKGKGQENMMKTMVGTLSYTAPEILKRKQKYDYTIDYWSVGVIMYILLCGYPPFWGESDDEIIQSILKAEPEFDPEEWDHVHPKTIELVRGLLDKDPARRKTLDDILQLTWKVSSQSLAFQKSHLRLKRHVVEKKMRAMSMGFIEADYKLSRRYVNHVKTGGRSKPQQKQALFADDTTPLFDNTAAANANKRYNRNQFAFSSNRKSKCTEQLYDEFTELSLPWSKRDSMIAVDHDGRRLKNQISNRTPANQKYQNTYQRNPSNASMASTYVRNHSNASMASNYGNYARNASIASNTSATNNNYNRHAGQPHQSSKSRKHQHRK